jgi:hypothetical protein
VTPAGRLPWHPIVLAAAIVITAWLDAAVSPYAAFRPLAIAMVLAAFLTGAGALVSRSWQLGGIIATATIAFLWSKQLIDAVVGIVGRAGLVIGLAWVLLIAAAVGLVAYLSVGRGRRPSLNRVTQLLNRTASLLLLATFVFGLISGRLLPLVGDIRQGISLDAWAGQTDGAESASRPDVYAILLDGYPRADVLEYAFGIDNSAFIAELGERGFTVADAAHSDYLWTHVSVPSALNLAYVEQVPALVDVQEGRAPRQPTLRHTVADNEAFETARSNEYVAIGVSAGFEEVAPRQADVYVDSGNLNEFEISLLTSTFSADVVNAVAPDFGSGQLRERIQANLDVLPEVAATRGRPPALVFAHVPAPHQPVVLGEGGAPVAVPLDAGWFADSPAERGQDPVEFADRYRAQLPYLNERILETIDGILAASATPPVIVLFADHGSASVVDWNVTQPAQADPARLLERTGILFAALTPGREDVFPEDISPVDLFRLLFDAYFGTAHGRATPPDGGGHVAPVDASVLDAGS